MKQDEAPTLAGWQAIENGLPEKRLRVFVCQQSGQRLIAYLGGDGRWRDDEHGTLNLMTDQPTHWMPLPPPPGVPVAPTQASEQAPEVLLKGLKLLEALLEPCSVVYHSKEHEWRKCRRCLATAELDSDNRKCYEPLLRAVLLAALSSPPVNEDGRRGEDATLPYRAKTSEHEILEAMERFGGGFVVALSRCFRAADAQNRRLLLTTFMDLFKQYDELASRPGRTRGAGRE